MPQYVFNKWFNIIKKKKWLVQEISLNLKRKLALSEKEILNLKAQRQWYNGTKRTQ
jgi:hypothetical protein